MIAICLLAVATLLYAEWRGLARLRTASKVLASTAFVLLGVTAFGASPFHSWMVVGLVFGAIGDVALLGRSNRAFVGGLAAFLVGHVAYVVGFVLEGVEPGGLAIGLVPVALIIATVGRRVVAAVKGGEEPELAAPVTAYVAVISAMVLCAFGTGDVRAMVGACLFAGSDSLIAWERFVRKRPWGPLVIIVTYHLAQALLVVSFT